MAAVTISSDFGALENKVCHVKVWVSLNVKCLFVDSIELDSVFYSFSHSMAFISEINPFTFKVIINREGFTITIHYCHVVNCFLLVLQFFCLLLSSIVFHWFFLYWHTLIPFAFPFTYFLLVFSLWLSWRLYKAS